MQTLSRMLSLLTFGLLTFPGAVGWAQNTVPDWSSGFTASAFGIRFERTPEDALDSKFSMLSEGMGYFLARNNLFASPDGSMSWIGAKLVLYPQIEASEFALAMGGELSFANNFIAVGAAVDAVNTATNRGFIVSDVEAMDVLVTISLGFNLGAGEARELPVGTTISAAKQIEEQARPPFNFVSFRR